MPCVLLKLIDTKLFGVLARSLEVKGLGAHSYSTEAMVLRLMLHLRVELMLLEK